MEAVAHNPSFAKKVGVPQSVGKDFSNADKGKSFKRGGDMAGKMKKGGMAAFEKSGKDVEKKGVKEGSKADIMMDKKQMMGMKKGGLAMRGEGSAQRGFAKGGMADNSGQSQGKTLNRPTDSIPGEKVKVRGVGAARSRTAMIY